MAERQRLELWSLTTNGFQDRPTTNYHISPLAESVRLELTSRLKPTDELAIRSLTISVTFHNLCISHSVQLCQAFYRGLSRQNKNCDRAQRWKVPSRNLFQGELNEPIISLHHLLFPVNCFSQLFSQIENNWFIAPFSVLWCNNHFIAPFANFWVYWGVPPHCSHILIDPLPLIIYLPYNKQAVLSLFLRL